MAAFVQAPKLSTNADGAKKDEEHTNGSIFVRPYLEMPTRPWVNDQDLETPDQPSSGFQTARASLSEGLDNQDSFPFQNGNSALDGTFVSPGASSIPALRKASSGYFSSANRTGKDKVPSGDSGANVSTGEGKNVSFLGSPTTMSSPAEAQMSPKLECPVEGTRTRKSERLVSRVRALKLPGHLSLFEDSPRSGITDQTPPVSPRRPYHRRGQSEGGGTDGDAEDTDDERASRMKGPATKRRRMNEADSNGAAITPNRFAFPRDGESTPRTSSEYRRIQPIRRSTMDDAYEKNNQGYSEDEGRARMNRGGDWRRRSSAWVQGVRHPNANDKRRSSTQETPSRSRPKHLRHVTAENANEVGLSTAEASPSTWRLKSEPAAKKWRELKAGLKLMGQKRKHANIQDQVKSAELISELLAGAPAAGIFGSHFLKDEGHQKRIPVLLEQLKFNITDSQLRDETGPNRNIVFRIELEYGSGEMRMKWVIYRSLRDFWNLHVRIGGQVTYAKLKGQAGTSTKIKIPRFPRTAFPFANELHTTDLEDEEEEEQPEEAPHATEPQTPAERPGRHKRGISSMHFRRRSTTGEGEVVAPSASEPAAGDNDQQTSAAKKAAAAARLASKQRAKLEAYLKALIRFVKFRPGMNRMCGFLEISALGIRLAVEGGFHGKEGKLILQSGKGVDFRREWVPKTLWKRHKPMWFLVRSSYLVCVDAAASMNIYDVFLIDPDFTVTPKRQRVRDQKSAKEMAKTAGRAARHPQTHMLRIANSERKIRLFASNERQMEQFEASLRYAAANTLWSQKHRFGSFAPVRTRVFAQWLVDARDYMWQVSRALEMARDVIYIHDWWLSPELYMRRPGAISHKWRLDRILQRKAQQGVKVFVILYRNIESAIPIDSQYTKFALLDLSPNIFVQRSPNQYRSNVFFWAHHEKICIVDQTVAFCGGVDLCFGRWDSPDHCVVDDRPTGWESTEKELNANTCQMWAGKDYSNPRVRDFFNLTEPFSEMYDRTKVPRMPWHDIGMQIVGQPARDLTRHFVQRWNYLLRVRKTSRPTPYLLPPPDFAHGQLEDLGLEGTCTIQMLRSAAEWSLGTPKKTEHSIMTAYCKLIQTSEHFVYMENQFFITSCTVDSTRIHNAIGDALVERVIRAHERGEKWKAVILIPLMPGFQATVDAQDGSSVRLIMQFQFRSICRGATSIWGRLQAAGIVPTDYIHFYSLRAWGKIGPTKALTTEQLYIHAKCMIVDDRHAIIGSANINERSMLGDRDSEVASVIFDHDMIDSTMNGQPYKVGRFPHTLRVRLMREHLGVDIDHVMDSDTEEEQPSESTNTTERRPSRTSTAVPAESSSRRSTPEGAFDTTASVPGTHSFNYDAPEGEGTKYTTSRKAATFDHRVTGTEAHKRDLEGYGVDNMHALEGKPIEQSRDTVLLSGGREVLLNNTAAAGKGSLSAPLRASAHHNDKSNTSPEPSVDTESDKAPLPPRPPPDRMETSVLGLTLRSQLPSLPLTDDTDIGGPPLQKNFSRRSAESLNPFVANLQRPVVEKDCMTDPLNPGFIENIWHKVAENNTKLYRRVFRCMPDREVKNWAQYSAAMDYSERFAHSQGMDQSHFKMQQEAHGRTGPPGHNIRADAHGFKVAPARAAADGKAQSLASKVSQRFRGKTGHSRPSTGASAQTAVLSEKSANASSDTYNEKDQRQTSTPEVDQSRSDVNPPTAVSGDPEKAANEGAAGDSKLADAADTQRRRRRANTKSSGRSVDPVLSAHDAETLMDLVQGNLVEWPYEWLQDEERGGKWFYPVDQMAPLEIYD